MQQVFTSRGRAAGRGEQFSTRIAFFTAGFGVSAWAPLVPFVKARAGLNDATLGLLLLCLGAGSIAMMSFAGAVSARYGCRLVILAAGLALCLSLPPLAVLSGGPQLAGMLLVFGAGLGALEVAMNIQAVIVERASGRPMMSGFHGMFSVGGIMGSAGMTAILTAGASPLAATLGVAAVIAAALAIAAPHLLPQASQTKTPVFALPRGVVLLIGLLCFICFMTEGAVLDWSAVFLASVRRLALAYSGLGYAAFAAAMTIGRLCGDRVVARAGGANVITVGAVSGAVGFAVAAWLPFWQAALLGYALIGFGCSNIVPVLFTKAGQQNVMPEHAAVPAIATLGYAGILAGPAAIGFVAHQSNLATSFAILAFLLLWVAAAARLL